jgi:drug/metabolite transporter (DMT)-like permease
MPVSVVAVVLVAAALHATWNAIAKAVPDQMAVLTMLTLTPMLCALIALPFVPVPEPAAWPPLAASAVVQAGYSVLLLRSYRLGNFTQAYPIARGTGPLLVAGAAAVLLAEPLLPLQWAGVVLVSVSLAGIAFTRRPSLDDRKAILAAVLTGVAIATYTVLDGYGVRRSGSAIGYAAYLFLLMGPIVPVYALVQRGRAALVESVRAHWALSTTAGVLTMVAYGLVVWAQTKGSLAAVAALRESSVVIAAALGVVVFRERLSPVRIVASIGVAVGIALINVVGR